MIVFYNPSNYSPSHVVFEAADEYMKWLEDPATVHDSPYVIIPERMSLEEIEILPGPAWRRRQPMQIIAPEQVIVGETFMITGVPNGATVAESYEVLGVMDASGVLEMTFDTPAIYTFQISCSGYITKEFTIEALPAA
jgi:hypothetical protein